MINSVVSRLGDAIRSHELEAIVSCFSTDYACEWPAHPARSFRGADQVRRNWGAVLEQFPDVAMTLTAYVEAGDEVWGEWHYECSAGDEQRGVIVMTVRDGLICRSRFYMEPVSA